MSHDPYAWYREALAGNKVAISDGVVQCGFFRRRLRKDGPWIPAAIWIENGKHKCRVGQEMRDDPAQEWTFLAKNVMPQEDVIAALNTGIWPADGAPEAPSVGHNNPPSDLADQIAAELENAQAWLKTNTEVHSQRDCTIAANMAGALANLAGKADEARKAEKQPHMDLAQKVDAKWRPRIDDAKDVARRLKAIAGKWLAGAELKLQQEHVVSDAVAPPKVKAVGGARGKKVALKTVKTAIIVDYDVVLVALKDAPEIRDIVQKIANRMVNADLVIPGVEVKVERRAV